MALTEKSVVLLGIIDFFSLRSICERGFSYTYKKKKK